MLGPAIGFTNQKHRNSSTLPPESQDLGSGDLDWCSSPPNVKLLNTAIELSQLLVSILNLSSLSHPGTLLQPSPARPVCL